jgi:hypothetical protein
VEPAEGIGREIVTSRIKDILDDQILSAMEICEQNTSARLDRQARLDRAREQREKLILYLDRWWTSLEGGVPEMETPLEPDYILTGLKRHRDPSTSKTDMARKTEHEDTMEMASEVVKDIMLEVGVRHDCGMSTACPAWYCCDQVEKADIERKISSLSKLISDLTLKDPELDNERDISEHTNGQDNLYFSQLQLNKKNYKMSRNATKKNNKTLQTQPIKNNIVIVVGPDGRSQKISWTNKSQAHPAHKDPEDLGIVEEYLEVHKADSINIISQAKSPVKDMITEYEKIIKRSLSPSSSSVVHKDYFQVRKPRKRGA